jgi:hypothetical protein
MGKEIVYCEICGDRILEQEFQKARAITLLNKNYCATCKEQAIRNIGIDEVAQDLPPAPIARSGSTNVMKAVKAPTATGHPPAHHAAHTPPHGEHGHGHAKKSPTGVHRAAVAPPPRSHAPLVAGAVVGGVLLVIILFVALGNGKSTDRAEPTTAPPPTVQKKEDAKPPPPADPKIAEAMTKLRTMTDLEADPQQILDEAKKTLALVTGTPQEAEVRRLETKARERLTNAARLKEIDRALADLAAMPGRDPEFLKFDDAMKLVDQALAAVRDLSDPALQKQREEQVAAAQKAYRDKYEQAAYEQYEAIYNLADTLGREGNPTQAKKVIEKFPVQFRKSQRWSSLQSMYERFTAMERKPDPKPAPQPVPKPEPNPEPKPVGKVDDYPSIEPPVVGQWVTVFDGKSLEKWHRIVQAEEKDGNWTVKDGVMAGVSSLAPRDGVQSAQDFLVLKYPAVTDFEMEWSMKVEGAGGIVGGRLVIQAPNAFCGLAEARNTEWKKYKMRFEGRTMTAFMDGAALPISNTETMPDAGRVFFSVYPGAKVFVKDVRYQRLK